MSQTERGRDPHRFAVPSELLRLADDEHLSVDVEQPVAAALVLQSAQRTPWPLGLTGRLVMTAAGGAVPVSVLSAIWLHAAGIERSVHASDLGLSAVLVGGLTCAFGAAPIAGLVADRFGRWRTGTVAIGLGALAGVVAALSGSVTLLALAAAVAGLAIAAWGTSSLAWLAEACAEPHRGRALAVAATAVPLGVALGAASVWRWGLLVSLVGLPLMGLHARSQPDGVASGQDAALGPTAQALRRRATIPGVVVGASVLTLLALGSPVLFATHLQHHWHLSLAGGERALLVAGVGVLVGGVVGGVLDARPNRAAAALALAGTLFAAAAYLRTLGLVELLWAGAMAGVVAGALIAARVLLAVSPPAAHATALGLIGWWALLVAGTATMVVAAFGEADGTSLAQLVLGIGIVVGAVIVTRSDAAFPRDVADADEPDEGRTRSGRTAALMVSNVEFSYGARQVLFDVSLSVDEGEVAALLGTNGAGKSTLLRLVAGLDHPSSGRIRIFDREVTFLEAEQIGSLDVALLSGGRMSFPSLTVIENLRLGAHRLRREGPRLRASLDEALELFPILSARRNQRVRTLSGGEQQMLGLARVLLLQPRLLLIDELSLGLAPKAVEDLLAVVRRVNERGTTVLLVEQSVNLALTLAHRAFFLERGEVRFDGPTAELLERDDLLRPVFLART